MVDSPNDPDILHGFSEYTDEELLEQSQFNAQALLMAAVLALGDDDAMVETWIAGVAEVMARGWDTSREWSAAEVLDGLLTNYRTYGGWVVEADLGAPHAAAIVADIPDMELAEAIGATDREADVLFRIGEHITQKLGRRMRWERNADTGDVSIIVT